VEVAVTTPVLIVDDSLTVRMDLAEAFEAAGFQAVPCASAAEARSFVERGPVLLIILDVLLPDGDGIELLAEMRAAQPHAAILMLTTEAEVKDRIRGLQTGADDYVGKPYDSSYVVARARELLRARHTSEAPAPQAKVLVIDDSATFRESMRTALAEAGYDITTAASGEEGLSVATIIRPVAIIVDGQLGSMDGATLIRHIRLDPALRRTPCLLLSGSEERGAELRALDAGADAFVRKEEDLAVILARLQAMIRNTSAAADDKATGLIGSKRILAVDDSPTYLHEISSALHGEGYDVVLARSGEEALELLAVQPVDCILLDLMMPGLSGAETCQRIKAAPFTRDIPLIMVTAQQEQDAMLDALGGGADDYISKSAELDVLKARLRAQLRRKQFEDENRRMREELLQRDFEAAEARTARELAETRARLASELERKNKELEAFSYSVSHDLRAPLRGIDGFSQALLEDYGDKLDEQGQDYLKRIRANAQRMGSLIDDLLLLSRVTRAELHVTPIDLAPIAADVVAELRRREPEHKITVTIQPSLVVLGDRGLLLIVLENLIGNAWKFSSKVQTPEITVGASLVNAERVCFVRDNGAGFAMQYAGKMFSPFQRFHTEAEYKGTGIGLSIVHRIIDRLGGRVWAESSPDQGATFFFTLPRPHHGSAMH
jgi:two-component system NtrC family sensor kinase